MQGKTVNLGGFTPDREAVQPGDSVYENVLLKNVNEYIRPGKLRNVKIEVNV